MPPRRAPAQAPRVVLARFRLERCLLFGSPKSGPQRLDVRNSLAQPFIPRGDLKYGV